MNEKSIKFGTINLLLQDAVNHTSSFDSLLVWTASCSITVCDVNIASHR